MRNWDLREFSLQVNLPFMIGQVSALIRRVIKLIRGLPNQFRQVIPLISHIRSYPPHRPHHHRSCFPLSSSTLSSSPNTKVSYLSLSLYVMIIIWHWVQHTPSTAYTEYSIHRVQCTLSTALTEYSIQRVQHTPITAYTGYSIRLRLFVFPSFSWWWVDPLM
jgi:hypothetical protein